MKRLLMCALTVPSIAMAGPFLVSDPETTGTADKCVYADGASAAVETPLAIVLPSTAPGCKIDLASMSSGNHSFMVWFKSSLWGTESVHVPFAFVRPAGGGPGPSGLRIQQ